MKAEILQIIDGGIKKNTQKVYHYSLKLAELLKQNGEQILSNKIHALINKNDTRSVSFDCLNSKPFDKDSHMDIVDVQLPSECQNSNVLYFEASVEAEIQNFIQVYHHRDNFIEYRLEFNNNLLLYGHPGTGKTSIAHYISNVVGLPLITAKLDSIVSSLLGSTAKNLRKLFEYADSQPCILFLDEFDVIAKNRDDNNELGELKRVVNSLIQNIDSFSKSSILIAATNTPSLLDGAVWRRFDTQIEVKLPSSQIRHNLLIEFLSAYPNNITTNKKSMQILSSITAGYSPAGIQNITNAAIKKAIIANNALLSLADMLYEILIFENGSNIDITEAVVYLNNHGVTQKDISKTLNMSIRQVRNNLEVKTNEEESTY